MESTSYPVPYLPSSNPFVFYSWVSYEQLLESTKHALYVYSVLNALNTPTKIFEQIMSHDEYRVRFQIKDSNATVLEGIGRHQERKVAEKVAAGQLLQALHPQFQGDLYRILLHLDYRLERSDRRSIRSILPVHLRPMNPILYNPSFCTTMKGHQCFLDPVQLLNQYCIRNNLTFPTVTLSKEYVKNGQDYSQISAFTWRVNMCLHNYSRGCVFFSEGMDNNIKKGIADWSVLFNRRSHRR